MERNRLSKRHSMLFAPYVNGVDGGKRKNERTMFVNIVPGMGGRNRKVNHNMLVSDRVAIRYGDFQVSCFRSDTRVDAHITTDKRCDTESTPDARCPPAQLG